MSKETKKHIVIHFLLSPNKEKTSYEARKFGMYSAMPMRLALRMCPDAVVLLSDMTAGNSGCMKEK